MDDEFSNERGEATENEIRAGVKHILRQLTALRSSIGRHNGREHDHTISYFLFPNREGRGMEENGLYDDLDFDSVRVIQEESPGSGKILNFTDLRVWQGAMDLAERVYRLTWRFPRQEQYGLSSQLQRSAVSIPSNIAEGHARNQTGDFLRFLAIARGSAAEVKTQILLAQRLDYVDEATVTEILTAVEHILRQLTALRSSIERHNGR